MDKIGRYEFLAEPFHCDYSGRLFMGHLGNHMLNAADFHSTARGFGNRQQYFGREGWGLYYWGDTFTQSHWYNRTDVAYDIIRYKNVSLAARFAFNFTDKGMQWHQMLTLRCNLGVGLYSRR